MKMTTDKIKLERLRRELSGIRERAKEIESEISDMEDVFLQNVGGQIIESGILRLLEWEIDYTHYSDGASVMFRSSDIPPEFNDAMREMLGDNISIAMWQRIPVGSAALFYSEDSVSLSIKIKKWHEFNALMDEVNEHGVERVNISGMTYSLKHNKIRVQHQTILLIKSAEIFTTSLKSKYDDENDEEAQEKEK
jgi:hypothetical protein